MSEKLAGHKFLARLGKKRLRPGGRAATEWLMQQGALTPSTRVLEVACNMGTTAIEIAQRYGCAIVGVEYGQGGTTASTAQHSGRGCRRACDGDGSERLGIAVPR